MNNRFKDKIVIVTGASSGIGEAIARQFSAHGSKVILAARSEDKLKKIVAEIQSLNQVASYVVTDVAREDDCKRLIEFTVKEYGAIDILINNAGLSMRARFQEVEIFVLKRLMEVNFWGTVYCTKYALPYLIKNRGTLVGVSSVAGFHGLPGRTGYSASKFAMHGFLETIRIENLRTGLHVMILAPGFTSSEIRKHALTATGKEQGESPLNEKKLMSSEYVAKRLLRAIRWKKRNKLLTWDGRLTALFQRILPEFVDWVYYKEMSKEKKSPVK
jgi:short-subunit dehydrogenase